MKHRIRIDAHFLQDAINLAVAGQDPKQKVLINVEDESGKVVRTIAIRLSHDEDEHVYTVEWVP